MVYIYNGILLSHKRNEISLFVTSWGDLEGIILSEISQRKIPYNFTYMWYLKYKTNEQT